MHEGMRQSPIEAILAEVLHPQLFLRFLEGEAEAPSFLGGEWLRRYLIPHVGIRDMTIRQDWRRTVYLELGPLEGYSHLFHAAPLPLWLVRYLAISHLRMVTAQEAAYLLDVAINGGIYPLSPVPSLP